MAEQAFVIQFDGLSEAEANRLANELREEILDSAPETQVTQQAADPLSQDFGATLVLLLGAPAVVAVAKGIQVWLERRNYASITIKTPQGEIVAKNLTSRDATSLVDRLRAKL